MNTQSYKDAFKDLQNRLLEKEQEFFEEDIKKVQEIEYERTIKVMNYFKITMNNHSFFAYKSSEKGISSEHIVVYINGTKTSLLCSNISEAIHLSAKDATELPVVFRKYILNEIEIKFRASPLRDSGEIKALCSEEIEKVEVLFEC